MTEAELFTSALEIEDESQREAFVNQACLNDPKRRERLIKLLGYSSTNGSFLEGPLRLADTTWENGNPGEKVGSSIGPYKLLQKIGEGGMGTVYLADQEVPVKRRVAVKVIKPGMDSAQVIARFEAERQSLVMMDHINIARALDVGTTEQGRPYFVMELVKGIPVTRYCDEQRLDTEKRLALFVPICHAIQHAHLKGIIHRDLKPSNVLVAEYDNQAIPKVIDFGVAKAVDKQLTQRTNFTQLGQVVGTVEYMSPEQSKLNQLDVDTRSDVYSLGVLLYELLTGSTPIQRNRANEVAWDDLTRMIREQEPPVPSVRISTSETIADIAACRHTEPGRLSRIVRGELDWIVMKALDKDRSRRYQTAIEFALDIQRYLNHEAVVACPPSTFYQFKKFARRHRITMVSATLVACSLMLGLVGTLWQASQAQRATILAKSQRDIARDESERAQQAQAEASNAMEQSKREAAISQTIVNFVNKDLLAFADPDIEPDRNIQLRKLLDRAALSVSELHEVPEVEAALRHTLATAYSNLGEFRESTVHIARALELRKSSLGNSSLQTLDSLLLLAEIQLKQSHFRDSSNSFQEAIDLCISKLGKRHPLTLRGLSGLGTSWFKLGRLDASNGLLGDLLKTQVEVLGPNHRDTLETRRGLAELQIARGRYKEAQSDFASLLAAMSESLGETHPLTLKAKGGLATVLTSAGKLNDAKLVRDEILACQSRILGSEHPETLLTASAVSTLSLKKGQLSESEQMQRNLLSIAENRLGVQHLITIQLSSVLADILTEQGKLTESKQLYETAQKAIASQLDHNSPISLQLKGRSAGLSAFSGRYNEAISLYQEVLDAQRLSLGPYHTDTLSTSAAIVELLMNQGNYDQCQVLLQELIGNAEHSLGSKHPIAFQAYGKLFTLRSVQGSWETQIAPYQELIALCDQEHGQKTSIAIELAIGFAEALERSGLANQSLLVYQERLPHSIELLGNEHLTTLRIQESMATALQSLGRFAEARKQNEHVLEVRRRTLGEKHPLSLRSLNNLAACMVNLGEVVEAEKLLRQAYDLSKSQFGPSFPATLQYGQNLASTLGLMKNGAESLSLYEEIINTQARLLGEAHPNVLNSKLGFAGAYAHQGRIVEAERLYASILPSMRKNLGESHPNTLRCLENLSVVVGEQCRYEDAIQLGKDYLSIAKDRYASSPPTHKMIHAIIEYHIVQGRIQEAAPFFDQSQDLIDRFGLPPDWMINDLPLLAYSYVLSGEMDAAEEKLKQHAKNCHSRFGTSHPVTIQVEIQLADLYKLKGKEQEAFDALEQVRVKLKSHESELPTQDSRLVLVRGKFNRRTEELASLAKIAASQGRWMKAMTLYSHCASISSDPPERQNGNDEQSTQDTAETYGNKAIESLENAYRNGHVSKPRELAMLKFSSDFELLRRHPMFPELIAKIDAKLNADFVTPVSTTESR